ncbi:hypothetical protein BDW02DRAFT_267203 [Decorospora gaudefroyi]|uniref:F-box domain-containing protein n=1 Tax=Decorospora gaudefroyi TaxID=184978 RepID=A0A6A5KIB8_9PLEO|nr:hypothetical protein BDW02DRAFT_267203 [Decorospora gaudefroyi]
MASLLTIPLELLVAVSAYLPTEDLGSLRLTCKQVEKSLYEWFSKEFFTKKQFMLTHKSLQALIDISRHASFSKKLTHVIIATDMYEHVPLRFRDEDSATRYVTGYEEQKTLLSLGMDREMLTEAFQRLENLTTVGIRDFNAHNRFRDGKGWTSWGSTTVYRETGIPLKFNSISTYMPEMQGTYFVSRLFSNVLYALGRANRNPPEFEVLLCHQGLSDTAFSLPDFVRPAVEPVLEKMTTLLLNVSFVGRLLHTHTNGQTVDPNAGRFIRQFLGCTPNLTHLRVNFEKGLVAHNESFLDWLGQPVPTISARTTDWFDPPPIALPFLKRLELGQLSVPTNTTVTLVTKFTSTLEYLSLWRMNLYTLSAPPIGHKPNLWKDLFERLSKIPQLNLTHLKVGMVQQNHMFVDFGPGEGRAAPLKQMEFSGRDTDKFWSDLQERVTVQWPEPMVDASDEDEDDEEDVEDAE